MEEEAGKQADRALGVGGGRRKKMGRKKREDGEGRRERWLVERVERGGRYAGEESGGTRREKMKLP